MSAVLGLGACGAPEEADATDESTIESSQEKVCFATRQNSPGVAELFGHAQTGIRLYTSVLHRPANIDGAGRLTLITANLTAGLKAVDNVDPSDWIVVGGYHLLSSGAKDLSRHLVAEGLLKIVAHTACE